MSRENFARLHQDANTACENDEFFKLCLQAETDKDLSVQIALGYEKLRVDMRQFWDREEE